MLVVGIGPGDPEQITVQAINALNRADVLFLLDMAGRGDLARFRRNICERYISRPGYRIVRVGDTEARRGPGRSRAAAEQWRGHRAEVYEQLVRAELPDGECGAFLVWGDPAIYDNTIAIIEHITQRGFVHLEYEVIPGISSPQALAARHRVGLTRAGRPLHVTTGRRLARGWPDQSEDVVVLLDGACSFADADPDAEIFWGAGVGTPDEILISGKVADVSAEIAAACRNARERKGWIMDTYLLRRRRDW